MKLPQIKTAYDILQEEIRTTKETAEANSPSSPSYSKELGEEK